MTTLAPRVPVRDLLAFVSEYSQPELDAPVMEAGHDAARRGWLTLDEFVLIGAWKSPRPGPWRRLNDADFVREVTRVALATPSERLRIEVLTLLDGVAWPTASVILHLAHRERYPILDIRALWTLGVEHEADCDFPFWREYVRVCRRLADEAGVDMRTLDRALWGYSKRHQPALT